MERCCECASYMKGQLSYCYDAKKGVLKWTKIQVKPYLSHKLAGQKSTVFKRYQANDQSRTKDYLYFLGVPLITKGANALKAQEKQVQVKIQEEKDRKKCLSAWKENIKRYSSIWLFEGKCWHKTPKTSEG